MQSGEQNAGWRGDQGFERSGGVFVEICRPAEYSFSSLRRISFITQVGVLRETQCDTLRIREPFNEWGGGCRKFVSVLGGDGTKKSPSGDMFDQPLVK